MFWKLYYGVRGEGGGGVGFEEIINDNFFEDYVNLMELLKK